MKFGDRLRENREKRMLSRADLAALLGVSPSAVGNYETSLSFPKEDVLLRLFDALRVSPNELFCDSYHAAAEITPSEDERALLAHLRALSPEVQQVVHTLAASLQQLQHEPPHEKAAPRAPRQIPLYLSPAAAGYVSPVLGEDFSYIDMTEDVPAAAEFAVTIRGDSMEPVIADGTRVYVNRDPLRNGDVGIFCVDGDMLCKQYRHDADGTTHLLSINRARADADRVLVPGSGQTLTCFGRVLLPHRTALVQMP